MRVNLEINFSFSSENSAFTAFTTWKLNHQEENFSFSSENSAFTAFRLSFNLEIESPRIKLLFLI
jgi:hypothetical protein